MCHYKDGKKLIRIQKINMYIAFNEHFLFNVLHRKYMQKVSGHYNTIINKLKMLKTRSLETIWIVLQSFYAWFMMKYLIFKRIIAYTDFKIASYYPGILPYILHSILISDALWRDYHASRYKKKCIYIDKKTI